MANFRMKPHTVPQSLAAQNSESDYPHMPTWVWEGMGANEHVRVDCRYQKELKVLSMQFFDEGAALKEMLKTTEPVLSASTFIIDCQALGVSVSQTVTKKVINTYSYGFSESIGMGYEIDGKVGVPLIASGEVKESGHVDFSSNQQWTKTDEIDFSSQVTMTPTVIGRYEVSMVVKSVEKIKIPFTATFKLMVKMKSSPPLSASYGPFHCQDVASSGLIPYFPNPPPKFDEYLPLNYKSKDAMVRLFNIKDAVVKEVKDTYTVVTVNGTLTASIGYYSTVHSKMLDD